MEQHVVARPNQGLPRRFPGPQQDQFAIEVERPMMRRPARVAPPPPIGGVERRLRLHHQAMFGQGSQNNLFF